jgi:hypothetical protein
MKAAKQIIVCVVCFAMLAGMGGTTVHAQQGSSRFFPETGHYVTGDFLAYYQSVSDAALVFGFPVTEAFVTNFPAGTTVQYFQRARFELRLDQPEGRRVQLTALGKLLYKSGVQTMNLNSAGACRTFTSGYSVCYDFLSFFDAHGGLNRFGNPISAFEFQSDGRITQMFERARFEWHPELPRGQNILLADLGSIYFYQVGEDPARLSKATPASGAVQSTSQTVISLKTLAFVWKAVTQPTDVQKVFVVVQDQTLSPVSGATGTVTVNLPGQPLVYTVTTDTKGIAVVSGIAFQNIPSGTLVQISVTITYGTLKSNATTSFRVWR